MRSSPGILASTIFLLLAAVAYAGVIAADSVPLPNRVATAEMVVFGKVTGFEEKTVTVNKTEYKIAKVEVADPVIAPKGTKTVRLGFVPPPPNVFVSPRPFLPEVGMDGCFFLSKGPGGEFLMAPGGLNFVSSTSENFATDAPLIKKCARILESPDAALKGKNAEDKFLAAAMLVARSTTRRSAKDTQEPIDAAQSKLILEALAGADWTPVADATKLSPLMVLGRLPLTAKDGWAPPKANDRKEYAAYAQRWVAEHAGTYRIQRWKSE